MREQHDKPRKDILREVKKKIVRSATPVTNP